MKNLFWSTSKNCRVLQSKAVDTILNQMEQVGDTAVFTARAATILKKSPHVNDKQMQ